MKKLVLTLSVLTIAACSYAQGISGGLKGGINLTNLSGDIDDTDMKIGFHGGVFVNFGITEAFSIQPEVIYNTAGAKSSYFDDYYQIDVDETYTLSYVSIPVMAVYSFGKFNVQAGPQLGLLMKADHKVEADGQSETEDIKEFLKGTDLGLNLGLGANFGKFGVTARYTIGLSNIADQEGFEVKTSNIQVAFAYTIFGGN